MSDGAAPGALTVWLPESPENQDELLVALATPLLRDLAARSEVTAAYFERINKPEWGVRLWVLGDPRRLEREVRPFVEGYLAGAPRPFAFAPAEDEDKWVGGAAERSYLMAFHQRDSHGCLEWLAAARRGAAGPRARFALLVVEGLLGRLALDASERLEFDRRGFDWEIELGRWDEEVFAALDEKFARQAGALRSVIEHAGEDWSDAAWGGPDAAGMGRAHLASLAPALEALLAAGRSGRLARPLLDFAVFAARAHVNRLGLSATQEATVRYLVWRARGGTR